MAGRAVLEYSDLERFPDDGLRRELIGGELFVTPSPVTAHQRAAGRINEILTQYAARRGGEAFFAPLDVVLGNRDVVQPDVMFVARDRIEVIREKGIVGVPSLVVEILSPSTRGVDQTAKRDLLCALWNPSIDRRSRRGVDRPCARPENGTYLDQRPSATRCSRRRCPIS